MRSIKVRDGREYHVRPLRPDDDQRISDAYDRLSTESKYKRFLGAKPTLTRRDVEYLVGVDDRDHVALAAAPADEPDLLVAVARFVRLEHDPAAAEFSIVVGDACQGAGLGSQLLELLAREALALGIERFVATILAENIGAHRLVNGLSPVPPRWNSHGAVDEVVIDLLPAAVLAA